MKRWLKHNGGFLILLLSLGIFRTAVADWNTIPSGSMRPTILEGDVILVNRVAYDLKVPLTDISLAKLGEPKRGEGQSADYANLMHVAEPKENGGTTPAVKTTEKSKAGNTRSSSSRTARPSEASART